MSGFTDLFEEFGKACAHMNGDETHTCHAIGCQAIVPPKLLMCARHWRMVPKHLQNEVWRTYVPGQEIRKDPTPEYLDAMNAAVDVVAQREKGAGP